jgi:putative membrane protein
MPPERLKAIKCFLVSPRFSKGDKHMALFFAALAGIIHLYIFCLESLLWGRAKTNRVFGISSEIAEHTRLFAFNQGFYNLFLAVAAMGGLVFGADTVVGKTLMAYALTSMLLAALVLIFSNRKLVRPALIQGLAPLLALFFLALQ